jgi:hypothetical protein
VDAVAFADAVFVSGGGKGIVLLLPVLLLLLLLLPLLLLPAGVTTVTGLTEYGAPISCSDMASPAFTML